jgi:hypothetical protein
MFFAGISPMKYFAKHSAREETCRDIREYEHLDLVLGSVKV